MHNTQTTRPSGSTWDFRRYGRLSPTLRAYGEGTLGFGFVDKTDITFVAPGANLIGTPSSFYDQTAAFTVGANAGLLIETGAHVEFFGQLGLRSVSGMSEVDQLIGSGLETINDKSSRWTLPFITGIRFRF